VLFVTFGLPPAFALSLTSTILTKSILLSFIIYSRQVLLKTIELEMEELVGTVKLFMTNRDFTMVTAHQPIDEYLPSPTPATSTPDWYT
jgi:hypothetical protein